MEIIPKLTLLQNPRTIPNGSIVQANNIIYDKDNTLRIDKDFEESEINSKLKSLLNNVNYKVINYLNTSNDIILFIVKNINILSIIRINNNYELKLIGDFTININNFDINKYDIISTFIYNVDNELILSFSEIYENIQSPLKIINIDNYNSSLYKSISVNPELKLPILNYYYTEGAFYKGTYTIFIRYKIDNNDYTNWFNLGDKIILNELKHNIISIYNNPKSGVTNNFENINDIFSDDLDYCNNTLKIKLINIDTYYNKYQLGFVLQSNDNTKTFVSKDINITNTDFILNKKSVVEHNLTELLELNITPYNVKSLESYNNSLYIGNYENYKFDDNDINNKIKNIKISGIVKKVNSVTNIKLYEEDDLIEVKKYKYNITKLNDKDVNIIIWSKYNNKINFIDLNNYLNCEYFKDIKLKNTDTLKIINSYNEIHYINLSDFYLGLVNSSKIQYTSNFRLENIKYVYINDNLVYESNKDNDSLDLPTVNYTVENKIYNVYLDKSIDLNNNITEHTLIPGTLYNFYIHFVNKYGDISGGYKIPFNTIDNLNKWLIWEDTEIESYLTNNNVTDACLIPISTDTNKYRLLVNGNSTIGETIDLFKLCIDDTIEDNINMQKAIVYKRNNNLYTPIYYYPRNDFYRLYEADRFQLTGVSNESVQNIIDDILNYYNFCSLKTKWKDLFNEYSNLFSELSFPFINKNNGYYIEDNYKPYVNNSYNYLKLKINNVELPKDCVNWFLTYNKVNYIEPIGISLLNQNNEIDNNIINVYNDYLNIKPRINKTKKIGFRLIKLHDLYNTSNNNTVLTREYINNLEIDTYEDINEYSNIKNIEILSSNDVSNNNLGLSTRIKITLTDLPSFFKDDLYKDYCVYCYYINDEDQEFGELIKCSNEYGSINTPLLINNNFGNISNITSLIFNQRGVYYDDNANVYKFYESSANDSNKPVNFISIPIYSEIIYELKQYNNKIDKELISIGQDSITYKMVYPITPNNYIDLWKNNYDDIINIKLYEISNNNNYKFYHTIRRSNPILDESKENNWRKFNQTIYKNIANNKGNIVKIINSGNILLIHTDYTLFVLDGSDTIKSTGTNNIQLSSVDIWDINFKELIPSTYKYAGLKNRNKSIIGEFGYIWWNEEKLLKLNNNNQFEVISDDIINYIKNYELDIEKLFDDYKNSRLFIKLKDYLGNIKLLSYNYKINSFISFHKYLTDSNTDFMFIFNDKHLLIDNNNIYQRCGIQYEDYSNSSFIDIIYNENYDLIKFLNSINYKFNISNSELTKTDDIFLENEEIAYPGDKIRIYSEFCDTNNINVWNNEIKENYNRPNTKYPYLYLGCWNFNNIRNIRKDNELNVNLSSDNKSLIYGNYFVIRFIFETELNVGIDYINFLINK